LPTNLVRSLAVGCLLAAAGACATALVFPGSARWLLSCALVLLSAVAAWILAQGMRSVRRDAPSAAVFDILECADGARVVTGADGRTVLSNSKAYNILGGSAPLAFFADHADSEFDGREAVQRLRQAVESRLADIAEVPVVAQADDLEWFRVEVSPLPWGTRMNLWSIKEITARKAIDDILAHERQDLSDFLYFFPAGVYSVDVDGYFHFVNQRMADWLGRDPDSISGLCLKDILVGTTIPQADGEWQGNVRFCGSHGKEFLASVFQSTYDDAGVTRTRSLVIRNSPGDPEDNKSRRAADQKFRSLFYGAPIAIAIAEPDGTVIDCNRAFEKLHQGIRRTFVGSSLVENLVEEDRRLFSQEVDRILSGESRGHEMDVRVQSEGASHVTVFLGPLVGPGAAAAGEVEGVVAHFIDTTEQKNLEVQFAQAQKMQAMGQLAGGVAHDFNNLLTAMIGFCDLLLQRHAAGDPSFADIMQIKQNANRAANLVRQLLAFSRKQPLLPQEFNVTDALTELSHLLTRLIGESIEFKLIHGRDLGNVRVDPGQHDQMIINLAVNARDAMPGGGTLTITTDTVTLSKPTQLGADVAPPGRYVKISVADTGDGIAREALGRIFEPFFSTKEETPGAGTGLGLATVYGIVRQNGGFIFVNSSPGQGATFVIYLPRIPPEMNEKDSATVSAENTRITDSEVEPLLGSSTADITDQETREDLRGDGTVLLVEDEDAVRVFAARALRNKGYMVLEARTGEQALEILQDQDVVDLIITDMMMPGMDGGTLSRLIRAERPEISIILISGYSEEVARGDVVNSPDIHFLPKPFSLGQLAAKVQAVLQEA